MAHPDPHGRPRRLLLPAVPVRRGDAGHADRALALLRPARLRARRAGPRREHQHARDVPRRRPRHRPRARSPRARSTSRRRWRSCSASPSRSRARAWSARPAQGRHVDHADLDHRPQRLPRPARPDARSSTTTASTSRSAARRTSRRCSTRSWRRLPGPGLLLAGGDNVGASPPNSALLEDMPTIDVENAWGLDATSLRQPRVRLRRRRASSSTRRGALPVPGDEHRRDGDRPAPAVGEAVERLHGQRRQVGVIGASSRTRPELVVGRGNSRADVPRRGDRGSRPSRERLRRWASRSRSSSSTRARRPGTTRSATPPACRGRARSSAIADQLQDTTVDP